MCIFFDTVVRAHKSLQHLCEGVTLGYRFILTHCVFISFLPLVPGEMNMSIAVKS